MVITESAVASTRLLGLGSKLYPKHHALNAQQRFYSIDSCSLSRARQKKDCVGGVYVNMLLLNLYFIYVTFYFLPTCCEENQAPGVALRLLTV